MTFSILQHLQMMKMYNNNIKWLTTLQQPFCNVIIYIRGVDISIAQTSRFSVRALNFLFIAAQRTFVFNNQTAKINAKNKNFMW